MIFATGQYAQDILPDPRINFWGEEHILPLRAYTHGYRIYEINEPNVILTLSKDKNFLDNIHKNDWKNHDKNGDYGMRSLMSGLHHFGNHGLKILGGKEFGPFAAKDEESYEEYIKAMGIDYRNLI